MRKITPFILMVSILGVSACQTTPDAGPDGADGGNQTGDGYNGGLSTEGADSRQGGQATALSEQEARDQALRQKLTVYFDFDSSQIRPEYSAMLDAHARYLRDNPSARLRLEGHTDERGTREYNIALGERRGEAVRRALLLRGATRAQLLLVSYGEEKPATLGRDEASMAQNRRVQMVYL